MKQIVLAIAHKESLWSERTYESQNRVPFVFYVYFLIDDPKTNESGLSCGIGSCGLVRKT